MARAHVTVIAAIALFGIGAVAPPAANAAGADVPFGCDSAKGTTCFFKLFLGARNTRIVQLLPGMKVSIPGLVVGRDHYCVRLNQAPDAKCSRIAINATYNH